MGYGLWIGLGPVLTRFEKVRGTTEFLTTEGRVAMFQDETRLIRDHYLVGTGLGTFGIAIRAYQTTAVDKEIGNAHNDYMESPRIWVCPGRPALFCGFLSFVQNDIFLSGRPSPLPSLNRAGCVEALLLYSSTAWSISIYKSQPTR